MWAKINPFTGYKPIKGDVKRSGEIVGLSSYTKNKRRRR
jgi:hypothetical protein